MLFVTYIVKGNMPDGETAPVITSAKPAPAAWPPSIARRIAS